MKRLNNSMHGRVLLCLLTGIILLTGICFAAEHPFVRIKGTVKYITSEGTYGVLSEDGKKYQPVRQLPKEYRKDGLAVIIEAKVRRDIVGARMWGTAIEISTIATEELFVSAEDKQAIRILLQRMEAFNTGDLTKLQQVDSMAELLTKDQLAAWLAGYGNFILHYAEAAKTESEMITGFCLYSRELQNAVALSGNIQHTLIKFTLKNTAGGWKIAETAPYRAGDQADIDQFITELKAKAKIRYGTDNLAKWKG